MHYRCIQTPERREAAAAEEISGKFHAEAEFCSEQLKNGCGVHTRGRREGTEGGEKVQGMMRVDRESESVSLELQGSARKWCVWWEDSGGH